MIQLNFEKLDLRYLRQCVFMYVWIFEIKLLVHLYLLDRTKRTDIQHVPHASTGKRVEVNPVTLTKPNREGYVRPDT
jgi:hypothetical protein